MIGQMHFVGLRSVRLRSCLLRNRGTLIGFGVRSMIVQMMLICGQTEKKAVELSTMQSEC